MQLVTAPVDLSSYCGCSARPLQHWVGTNKSLTSGFENLIMKWFHGCDDKNSLSFANDDLMIKKIKLMLPKSLRNWEITRAELRSYYGGMGCYHSPVKSNTHYISCGPGFESLSLHSFTLIKLIYPMDNTICLLNLSLNCEIKHQIELKRNFAASDQYFENYVVGMVAVC